MALYYNNSDVSKYLRSNQVPANYNYDICIMDYDLCVLLCVLCVLCVLCILIVELHVSNSVLEAMSLLFHVPFAVGSLIWRVVLIWYRIYTEDTI